MSEYTRHILWVTTWYPNAYHSTLGNFVQRHAAAAALENVISVICPLPGKQWNVDIVTKDNVCEIRSYYPRKWRFVGAYLAFKRALKKLDKPADAVHGHALIGCWWMLWYAQHVMRKPTLLSEHWAGFHHRDEQLLNPLKRWFMKRVGRGLNNALPVTKQLGETMKRMGYIKLFNVVPNVVDTDLFVPKTSSSNPDFCRFIHVSTLDDAQKNIRGILNAAKALSELTRSFHLEIIGDGAVAPWIELARRLDLYPDLVSVEGENPLEEIASHLTSADVFVLFSRYENFPCVIAEAWSSGLPIISTNVGGISEHLTKDNGVLIESENQNELVEAMLEMISTHGDYVRDDVRDYAKGNFSYGSVAARFSEWYRLC